MVTHDSEISAYDVLVLWWARHSKTGTTGLAHRSPRPATMPFEAPTCVLERIYLPLGRFAVTYLASDSTDSGTFSNRMLPPANSDRCGEEILTVYTSVYAIGA